MATTTRPVNGRSMIHHGALCAAMVLLHACAPEPEPHLGEVDPHGRDTLSDVFRMNYPLQFISPNAQWSDFVDRRKCPPLVCDRKARLMDKVCREAIPLDHRVWMARSNAAPCYCTCRTIDKLPWHTIDSIRFNRQVVEATLLKSRMERRYKAWVQWQKEHSDDVLSTRKPSQEQGRSARHRLESMVHEHDVLAIGFAWSRENQAHWLFDKFQEHYPIFIGSIVPYSGNAYPGSWLSEEFRYWRLGEGPSATDTMKIHLPDVFVHHPAVGWELMAFFIAHELGHGLGEETRCTADWDPVCEAECDHYGTNVILRRVFMGEEYVNVAQRAADQLHAFMNDTRVELYPDCGGWLRDPSECPGHELDYPACGYPPRYCRVATIRSAALLERKPSCTTDWPTSPLRVCPPPS